jgi:broad specificity phosphatase PhoE
MDDRSATVTTLLLVRHGETDWNREGRWQGLSDTHLNDQGREQARSLALQADGVDVIYSSDLARASETAEIVAEDLGLDVRLDERLRERGFGEWEGLNSDEIEERFAEAHGRWKAGEGPGAENAEPFAAFAGRIHDFVDEILERHPGETVLVVSHGGSIRVIHALAAGLDYVRDHRLIPGVPNCTVARYAARDGKLAQID